MILYGLPLKMFIHDDQMNMMDLRNPFKFMYFLSILVVAFLPRQGLSKASNSIC